MISTCVQSSTIGSGFGSGGGSTWNLEKSFLLFMPSQMISQAYLILNDISLSFIILIIDYKGMSDYKGREEKIFYWR